MSPLLQPSWPVLALFFAQKFLIAEATLLLALPRVVLGRGPSRIVALLAALLAAAITLTVFAPAAGLTGASWYPAAARALTTGGGLAWPLAALLLLALSSVLPGARHRWIDAATLLLLLAVAALWFAARAA
ncbi:hypothetical protein OCH239_00965 [Roseivivax halodurans JCM 10272]|uniref:Uncharacterized protein n=1 Tax=Roseivivax halodurans JCM 10272 TaxID=1449350 RepID=X7EK37_9RHOB|nr:hypothetical protein [Roseivivax halodurans]ETX16439.1 hypothetical protein OCH239_00965 [Roseivivax halodurans JCM 10272]